MPKEKTICEVEFEKWWKKSIWRAPEYQEMIEYVWNQAGDKIMESIKKKGG